MKDRQTLIISPAQKLLPGYIRTPQSSGAHLETKHMCGEKKKTVSFSINISSATNQAKRVSSEAASAGQAISQGTSESQLCVPVATKDFLFEPSENSPSCPFTQEHSEPPVAIVVKVFSQPWRAGQLQGAPITPLWYCVPSYTLIPQDTQLRLPLRGGGLFFVGLTRLPNTGTCCRVRGEMSRLVINF